VKYKCCIIYFCFGEDFCIRIAYRLYKKAVLSQRWPRDARYISGSNESLWRYGHSKLSKMAACGQLGFDVTGNSAIRSADPKPYPWTKHEVHRITRCGDMAIAYGTHFGRRGGRSGSVMAPFERAMVVSYRLSIVTVALSVTIRLQFAIECLRHSNQHGVGHFGPKFPVATLGVNPWCLGLQRANAPR